ncbi:hypothetical protein QUW15_04025 [Desulfovibrio piger]|nr:hypothetical protein [Desulfovibrio piger]
MKRFWTMALCLALACGLPGCKKEEEKSPGTLMRSVSGNYAEDFTAGGWATARLTATAVDAKGKSLPIDNKIRWTVLSNSKVHDKVIAWNRDRDDECGLSWAAEPQHKQPRPSSCYYEDALSKSTVFLTDVVGSRTVTVRAELRVDRDPEDVYGEDKTILAEITFTFGDGPLSLFSVPPRRVASREEAERYCAASRPAAQQGGKTEENGLPPATLLQLVSNNRINGYGAALAAGWPGDFEEHWVYSYWAGETDKDGDEGRVVNVADGFALWYGADVPGPLAVCAPKNTPAPPAPVMSPEKAALRAEAEEMLLPRHPKGLVPAPDVWKLRCGSIEPYPNERPYVYGVPPLAEYNGCYTQRGEYEGSGKPSFTAKEVLRFDPATIPNAIIIEPSFSLTRENIVTLSSLDKYGDYESFPKLIRKAREGNPIAMRALSRRFPTRGASRYFWWRMADALTSPGWAYVEEEGGIGITRRGLMGYLSYMQALGSPFLEQRIKNPQPGDPDYKMVYREITRECALRGRAFAWESWTYMYVFNTAGVSLPDGVLDKPNPTRGYAMELAAGRLPLDTDDNWGKVPRCEQGAIELERTAAQYGIDVPRGRALAEELFAVYLENHQRVLERQRRHRARMLPEVNRQIDGWLKDMERLAPEWLKKKWPTYPAYGDEDA